jgi:alkaline phosphatase D
MGKFENRQLKNMVSVGMTKSDSVCLWMRSEKPGKHEIQIWPENDENDIITVTTEIPKINENDNTLSVRYPDDFNAQRHLNPTTRYKYRIKRKEDDIILGNGNFETFPSNPVDTPKEFSIACMSCHQPFNSDGDASQRSLRLLRVLPNVLKKNNVKFILLTGDQIYADIPENFSLINPHYINNKILPEKHNIFEFSESEVRQAYQHRYRIFWEFPEVKHFYANYPCYPILDDHEIMDDWGSNPNHKRPKFNNLFNGARRAYLDYQGARIISSTSLPASFHYGFEYGSVGVFVMDLRSERKAFNDRSSQLYSDSQLKDLETFLEYNHDKHVLLIVTSVPVIHLPGWLADIGETLVGDKIDFPDHWSFNKNRSARDNFLNKLYLHQKEYPNQKIALVSGDVHIGCTFEIKWKKENNLKIIQFTSSAISNRLKKIEAYAGKLGPELVSELECKNGSSADVSLLKSTKKGSKSENPFGGLNVGIIQIKNHGNYSNVNFKLVGYEADEQWNPQTMFESGEV